MGSRGAFKDVNENDFTFIEDGKNYTTIYYDKKKNIKLLKQEKGSVKVPDYSHSPDRIYAVIQNEKIKSIGIYENHKKIVSIDLEHFHKVNGIPKKEHVHTDLYHHDKARDLTEKEKRLVLYIKKLYKMSIKNKTNVKPLD